MKTNLLALTTALILASGLCAHADDRVYVGRVVYQGREARAKSCEKPRSSYSYSSRTTYSRPAYSNYNSYNSYNSYNNYNRYNDYNSYNRYNNYDRYNGYNSNCYDRYSGYNGYNSGYYGGGYNNYNSYNNYNNYNNYGQPACGYGYQTRAYSAYPLTDLAVAITLLKNRSHCH